jgi:hypothetical protein
MVIMSIVFLFGRKNFDLVLKLYGNTLPVLVKGLVNVILGIVLLLYYSLWATNLGTILGWVFLIGGLLSLFFPRSITKFASNVRKNKALGTTILVIVLLIGLYLTYIGFTH